MIYLKPKDMALILDVKPYQITKFAKDIESSNMYKFKKTPLGSYLFKKEEIEMLKEYKDIYIFFKNKKNALKMVKIQGDIFSKEVEGKPEWTKYLSKKVQEKIKKP